MNYLLLIITIIGWGLWGFLSKLAVGRLHPLQMFLTASTVNACLFPIYYYFLRASNVTNPINIGGILLVAGACLASVIGSVAYTFGIQKGELGTIAVLSCSYPVLTVLLATLFLGESLTFSKMLGIACVMAGILILAR